MRPLSVVGRPDPTAETLADLIDQYISDCKRGANGHKKLSWKTVEFSYAFPLRGGSNARQDYPHSFVSWAAREGIKTPEQLTQDVIDRFAEYHKNRITETGKPLAEKTVATYVTTVQHWVNWLAKKGYLPSMMGHKGPIAAVQATVETPKEKPLDVLSREEIKQLERAAHEERDALIIRVLADTGIRLGELVSLTTSSLIETRLHNRGDVSRYLRVSGKTGWRDVPVIDPDTWSRLKRYRDRIRPQNAKTDTLFVTRRRHVAGGDYDPITVSSIGQMVKTAGQNAGIPRAHPHLFRHSAATLMLQRGMDSVTVAKVLGHTSLSMLNKVYAHLAPQDTYAAMVRYLSD